MLDNATISVIGHAAGVGIIAFSTVPSILQLGGKANSNKKIQYEALYEDKDGVATDESEADYSVKWPRIIASIAAGLGVGCSIAFSVLATLNHVKTNVSGVTFAKDWAPSFAWLLICTQVLDVNLERRPVRKFTTALVGAISSLLLLAMLAVSLWFDEFPSNESTEVYAGLSTSQLVLCFILGVSLLSVPRRPDVYLKTNEKLCERQRTVSWISRLGFHWTTYLIDLAAKKTLALEDLPGMDFLTRSRDCHNAFPKSNSKIWRRILMAHWPQFIIQWTLVMFATAFQFAPRFSMLHLLRILEARGDTSVFNDREAWLWVLLLGASNMVSILIDTQLTWTMWSDLAIPVRAELGALVFSKAMKKKDCKEAPKEAEKAEEPADPVANGDSNGDANGSADKKTNSKKKEIPESNKPASDQGVINLIAVDATRVSQMTAWQRYYFSIVFGIAFSCAFLWMLIGWKSLLVGLATNILATPFNAYFAQVYSNAQKQLMEARDKKVGVVTEALTGIRQIKFSALEGKWEDRVNEVRSVELAQLWRSMMADTVQRLAYTAGPVLLTAAALSTYVYINGTLSASVAFTALGVFSQLESWLGLLPDMITTTLDAKVSADRIDEFLKTEERIVNREKADSISFDKVSVTFPSDDKDSNKTERFTLRDINLQFPNNELSVISGKTGCGKTLLLNAILGEVDVLDGTIRVPTPPPIDERFDDQAVANNWIIPSSIAYVSQIPWIENATIKNNITFGLPFDEIRYNKVIEACALKKDLEMLEDGDATEVGAQGISISGGQRWRLTFARALYSRAGILILDDLFSALDAHVGKHIFENALTGELCKKRTRILVTHHVALCLPQTKYAVFLSDGTVERAGLIEELQSSGGLTEILNAEEEVVGSEGQLPNDADAAPTAPIANGALVKSAETPKTKPKKLIEEEARETGGIKRKVYANYINATGGIPFWLFVIVGFIIAQTLTVSRSYWIKEWTASYNRSTFNATDSIAARLHPYTYQEPLVAHSSIHSQVKSVGLPVSDGADTLGFYLGIYVAISTTSILIGTARFLWLYTGSIRASRILFAKLTKTILHMDLRWIDTNPLGRILNRFTADFSIVDAKLSHGIAQTAASSFQVLGVVAAGLFVSPYMIILALALLAVCASIGKKYLNAAREVKRLESICKSPIFEQFGSALKGVSTIRAFDNVEVFVNRMYSRIDAHSTAFWHISLFNRWMICRMSMVGSIFSVTVAALVVSSQGISASLAGFALAFSLEFSQGLIFAIAFYASTELDMNAAERIIEYSNLETEDQGGIEVPAAWPAEGKLEVKDLVVGYAEGLPDILKGLSFSVDKHQRVGIVGRTGAGKSSVTLALFRFLKARSGTIHVDGIDISKIKLHDLRSRLAIIPQDPVLFSGTVRSNIDPFSQLEDYELKEALRRVHLVHSPESRDEGAESSAAAGDNNINIFESLSSTISEGGLNLSQGQRQLLCLARAIVSRPKIMVLDEATSAVDMATDQLIQRSIREEFSNTTLIVIAHRLSTISDFDKILVLDDGKAVEFGTPAELLEKKDVFFGMVADSGEAEKIEEMIRDGVARVDA